MHDAIDVIVRAQAPPPLARKLGVRVIDTPQVAGRLEELARGQQGWKAEERRAGDPGSLGRRWNALARHTDRPREARRDARP